MTGVFWNVCRKPLAARVARLAAAHGADVVVLTECVAPAGFASVMAAGGFQPAADAGEKMLVFSRFPPAAWACVFHGPLGAWAVFRFRTPGRPDLLFAVVHLPSKLWAGGDSQMLAALELAADVQAAEAAAGHSRTVLVGDFNMNPFEPPMVHAAGLHAVPTRAVARRESRVVRGRDYPMFYNPTWGVAGDRTPGPPGTYYRAAADAVNYFWNTYDQVLLRPAVMDRLAGVRVLDSDDGTPAGTLLTAAGVPDAAGGSDHLPVWFQLDW